MADSLLQFPCEFPIKAVGAQGTGFEDSVYALIKAHAPELTRAALRRNPSRGGKYLAITATIEAQSQEQLDAIYRELSACDQVIMAL